MDQVRIALAWIKQYHFWLLCVLAAIAGTVSWYLASTALAAEFDKNRKAIDAEFTASGQVRSRSFHANEVINQQQRAENRRLAQEVRALWASLHGRQREEVLKWPEELGPNFLRRIEGLQFGDPIPIELRQRYQNYIETFYPQLPKIVGALEAVDRRRSRPSATGFLPGRRGAREGDEEEEEDYLVEWADQEYIRDQLNLETTPSKIRMWVTQEDLWVYITLLRSIASVNTAAEADRYTNAAIRDIVALEVGRPAAENRETGSRIERPESADASGFGGGFDDEGGDFSFDGGGDDFGDSFGDGFSSGAGEESEAALLAGRYIDADGKPMAAAEGDYRYGTEFKRLPVRLELLMDQRWLPSFVAELSNAPLQVEVTEVRINPESGGSSRSRGGRRRLAGSDETLPFTRDPNLSTVVMRGTVYIYNPVDEAVLAVDGEDEA